MQKVMTNDLAHSANNNKTGAKQHHKLYFDIDATYTVSYISRLLGVSQRIALRYVNQSGQLTERGMQTLADFNEAMNQDFLL